MAGENLSSIGLALSQIFAPTLYRQWNRTAVLLGLIAAAPAPAAGISQGLGKNVAFDTEFTGATAQTVAEGADVPATEYNSDVNVPAILPWAHYRSSFQVTETEFDAAMSSVGVPQALMDLFGDRILGNGAKLARQLESDALIGTGTDVNGNATLVGLYNALISSGAYAGLSTATYTEWVANIVGNGGVNRPLTADLLAQVDANIFTASSIPWTHVMTSPGVLRKFEGLFEPNRRINDNMRGTQYGTGAVNDGATVAAVGLSAPQMQPDAWYKGLPVLRNAVNPTGKALFLNTNFVAIKYLPRRLTPADIDFLRFLQLPAGSGIGMPGAVTQATMIPARISVLAKTGDSYKISLKLTLAMCVTRLNSMGILQDVSEV